jgi:hypothetical protein
LSLFGCGGESGRLTDIDPPPDYSAFDKRACWSEIHDLIAYVHARAWSYLDDPDSSGIYLINPDGTDKRLLLMAKHVRGIDWSPDGEWIVANVGSELWKISYPDGIVDILLTNGEYYYPSWSPDGTDVCYSALSGPDAGVYIYNLNDANSRKIIPFGYAADWTYPDSLVYLNLDYGFPVGAVCMADSSGSPIRIIYDLEDQFIWSDFLPRMHMVTRNIVFQAIRPGEIPRVWRLNNGNSEAMQLFAKAGYPNFSPNGNRVVFTRIGRPYANLWIINWDGTGLRELTESRYE